MTTNTTRLDALRLVVLYPVPPRAEAMEQRLREIRQQTTEQERLQAYRDLLRAGQAKVQIGRRQA